jgi:ribosome-binding protein aMBF1 (putative translation factor)
MMVSKTKSMLPNYPQEQKLSSTEIIYKYCKRIKNWPASWKISKEDLAIGQAIIEQFKLFLINRIEKGRAKRTIKRYTDYLWVLGGELIRRVNEDDAERNLIATDLILKYIDDDGGPYWHDARDEAEHAEYDSVCRQLFKFMTQDSG